VQAWGVAVIDIPGFVASIKEHAIDHGFHIHDERHFIETYSMRQLWEVDLHPEEACGGPLDMHLSLEVEPRVMLAFEDEVTKLDDDDDPTENHQLSLVFTWSLPPLSNGPDLLVLATELAGKGGTELPLEVAALDTIPSVTDAPERSLSITAKTTVTLARIFRGEDLPCEIFDRGHSVSLYLLEQADHWLS
jgi:hypothetical protein